MPLPWVTLLSWKPFQIDALGLVTLLGADEVNAAIGRLVPSTYLEYFPLLGAFVIAGDRFKEKKPSFNLYNITQGLHTTDMSCWLTRWMLAQEFEKNRSIVHFEVVDKPRSQLKRRLIAGSLSFIFTGMLLVMTILSEDWYGIANVTAMVISILVRAYILHANRQAIDDAITKAESNAATDTKGDKKCMVVMSDSKAVTLELPGHLIVDVFVTNPEPSSSWLYHLVRWVGWGGFAVHVLAIGQTKLANQLYSVVLIVVPTVLVSWKFGCDDSKWLEKWHKFWNSHNHADKLQNYECWFGSRLRARVFQWPHDYEFTQDPKLGRALQHTNAELDNNPERNSWYRLTGPRPRDKPSRRQDLYAWLSLSDDELASMGKWDLFPHERDNNQVWWNNYKVKNALIQDSPHDLDTMCGSAAQSNGTASNGNNNNRANVAVSNGNTAPSNVHTRRLSDRTSIAMHDLPPTVGIVRTGTDTVITPEGRVRQVNSTK